MNNQGTFMSKTMRTQSKYFTSLNIPVFVGANILILALLCITIFVPNTKDFFSAIQTWIVDNLKWYYILSVAIILGAAIFITFSRFGDIRLGPDHSRPTYSNFSWFAMLFSTGMGIGLMFFGVAEPVMHYIAPPVGEPETIKAATEAMRLTFFHWGLHAWAIYAIVGLILAYFCFRHKLPLALRSALYPLIGERIYGKIGDAIDIFAVIGTAFGVATSLGFGVEQIFAGLDYLTSYKLSAYAQDPNALLSVTGIKIIIVIIATAGATLSVSLGLDKGIKILSETNLYMALALMLLVLFLGGKTVMLFQAYIQNIGSYLSDLVNKTFNLYAYEPKDPRDWIGGWTILYWGWWLSWSPFVGMFIARISRGRTIRTFLLGVLLVPAGFTLLWMTVFGNSAIDMIRNDGIIAITDAINTDKSLALFVFLEGFPWSSVLSGLSIVMVYVFFITSADSGAIVMDMLSSTKTQTPLWQRIYWGSITGVIAIVLMSANGLEALQTATIASAFPFSIILLVSLYGLFKALRVDYGKKEIRMNSINNVQTSAASGGWQKRLRSLVLYPRRDHVIRFIDEVVQPAFDEVAAELSKQGIQTTITRKNDDDIIFEVDHGKNDNFMYQIKARHYLKPNFSSIEASDIDPDYQKYFRAEVHLDNGAQGYDIMGYSKESLSNDIVDQYTNHLQFIHNFQLEHDVKSVLKETNNGSDANGNSETTEEPSKA